MELVVYRMSLLDFLCATGRKTKQRQIKEYDILCIQETVNSFYCWEIRCFLALGFESAGSKVIQLVLWKAHA